MAVSGDLTLYRFEQLTIECVSRAGDETWLRVQPPGLAFDVGRGSPRLRGIDTLFLTHGHLDHALGVAYLLSLRSQGEQPRLVVHCPADATAPLAAMLEGAARLDGEPFSCQIRPVEAGDRFEVGDGLQVEAYATEHVVPSVGYHLRRRRTRLRQDLTGLDEAEIARRSRAGETVDEQWEECWFSYTGDTAAGVFDRVPELYESRILWTECTFLDSGHRDRAVRFGHIHLDDLVERRERFRNEVLILGHLSGRHRPEELRAAIGSRLGSIRPRVRIVGEAAEDSNAIA